MEKPFLIRLTNSLDMEEAGAVSSLLLLQHIEVYVQDEEIPEKYRYLGEGETCPAGCLYVPRADYRQAVSLLKQQAPAALRTVSEEELDAQIDSEMEQIRKDFLKKRKWHMLEWLIIILMVFVYLWFRSRG